MHGGDIALIEGARRRGKNLKDSQGAAIMAEWRDQDGAHAQTAATGKVDARISLRIMAQHDFAGADCFGRNAYISLQANPEVGSGAAGAGAADDLVSSAQSDGSSGGSRQVLGALRDGTNGGLKVQLGSVNLSILHRNRPKTGRRVHSIRDPKLAAHLE